MNPIVIAIVASVLAVFVVACGLKLIDLGSSFTNIIVKAGPAVACVLGVIAVFNFMLIDALELIDMPNVALVGVISLLAFSLLRFIFDVTHRGLLIPKRAKSRKSGRASKLSIAALFGLDFISGLVAGAVAGVSFALNIGTGIVVVCAIMMLMLDQKISLIRRYQNAHLKRGENIAALAMTLIAFPVAASLVCLFARDYYSLMGVFLSVALGYLLCWSVFKAVEIVKTLRKS